MDRATHKADFGARIRRAREEIGMSQRMLADRLDSSQNAISLYEKGKRSVPVDLVYDLARELDKPVSYFFDFGDAVTFTEETSFYEVAKCAESSAEDARLIVRMFHLIRSQWRR